MQKYKQAKSLYENKRYVESLQTALYLNEQVKTTNIHRSLGLKSFS